MLKTFNVVRKEIVGKKKPDCAIAQDREDVATIHSITEGKFELFLRYFIESGGVRLPNPHPFPHIITLLDTPLPGGQMPEYIEFVGDTTTGVITHTPKHGTPILTDGNHDYSACLFRGVKALDHDPVTIEFYVAKNDKDEHTVIFSTILADGSNRYYDLSNDLP